MKEKALLTWNENRLKNDVSGGKKPEKNKKNKGQGAEAKAGRNAILLSSQTKRGRTSQLHDCEVLHRRG